MTKKIDRIVPPKPNEVAYVSLHENGEATGIRLSIWREIENALIFEKALGDITSSPGWGIKGSSDPASTVLMEAPSTLSAEDIVATIRELLKAVDIEGEIKTNPISSKQQEPTEEMQVEIEGTEDLTLNIPEPSKVAYIEWDEQGAYKLFHLYVWREITNLGGFKAALGKLNSVGGWQSYATTGHREPLRIIYAPRSLTVEEIVPVIKQVLKAGGIEGPVSLGKIETGESNE